MPTFGDPVQALGPSSPRKRPASRVRTLGDFVQSMDPSARSPGIAPPPSPLAAPQRQAPVAAPSMLRPGEFNSPPPPHPGLQSPFQTSVAPVVGTPAPPMPAPDPNAGLRAGVNAIAALNQQAAAGTTPRVPFQPGPTQPRTTFGGAFGAPGSQPLPFERTQQPPAMGLGLAPQNEQQFTRQMDYQNTNGRFFGGTLPTLISTAGGVQPGFLSGPMREGGMTPETAAMAAKNLLARGASTTSTPGQFRGSASMFTPRTTEQTKALEEGHKNYLAQRESVLASRQAGVTARAQQKAEARRMRLGNMTFEERLAAMNPAAAQGRAATEAQAKAAQLNFNSRLAVDRERIAADDRMATERNASNERVAGAKIDAESGPKPPPPSPLEAPPAADFAHLSPAERKEVMKDLPQATRDRLEDELSRKGYFTRLFTGIDQPGQAPISESLREGMTYGDYNPFARPLAAAVNTPRIVNPRRNPKFGPADMSRIPLDKLKEQPGDTPVQKRLKAEERAKRSA